MNLSFYGEDTTANLDQVHGFSMQQIAIEIARERGYSIPVGTSGWWFKHPVTGDVDNFYMYAIKEINNPKYKRTGDIAVTVKDASNEAVARVFVTQEDVKELGIVRTMQLAREQVTGVSNTLPPTVANAPSSNSIGATAGAAIGATSGGSSGGTTPYSPPMTMPVEAPSPSSLPKWLLPAGIGLAAFLALKG